MTGALPRWRISTRENSSSYVNLPLRRLYTVESDRRVASEEERECRKDDAIWCTVATATAAQTVRARAMTTRRCVLVAGESLEIAGSTQLSMSGGIGSVCAAQRASLPPMPGARTSAATRDSTDHPQVTLQADTSISRTSFLKCSSWGSFALYRQLGWWGTDDSAEARALRS